MLSVKMYQNTAHCKGHTFSICQNILYSKMDGRYGLFAGEFGCSASKHMSLLTVYTTAKALINRTMNKSDPNTAL